MRVELVANTCFSVTFADGQSLLTDPWFMGPTMYGAWHNFPPLPAALKRRYMQLRPDCIFISHLHPDHFDPATLALFDRDTRVVVLQRSHTHLQQRLSSLGFRRVEAYEPGRWHPLLPGVEAFFIPQLSATTSGADNLVGYELDSSICVRDRDGASFLDINDNPIQLEHAHPLREAVGPVSIAVLPCTSASSYPHRMAYAHEEKIERRDALVGRLIERFCAVAQAIGAVRTIPAAGNYVLGGSLSDANVYLPQPPPSLVQRAWVQKGLADAALVQLVSGDAVDTSAGAVLQADAPLRAWEYDDRVRYGHTLRTEGLAHEAMRIPAMLAPPWPRLLQRARRNLWEQQQRLGLFLSTDIELRLQLGERTGHKENAVFSYTIALDSLEPPVEAPRPERAYIRFELDGALMLAVLFGGAIWDNVDTGSFLGETRQPDELHMSARSLLAYFTL